MEKLEASHTVTIKERQGLEITGVADVLSFDEASALLRLCGDMGMMSLEGEDLHMSEMDSKIGLLKIDGRISGLVYAEKGKGKSGLFGKRK